MSHKLTQKAFVNFCLFPLLSLTKNYSVTTSAVGKEERPPRNIDYEPSSMEQLAILGYKMARRQKFYAQKKKEASCS